MLYAQITLTVSNNKESTMRLCKTTYISSALTLFISQTRQANYSQLIGLAQYTFHYRYVFVAIISTRNRHMIILWLGQ